VLMKKHLNILLEGISDVFNNKEVEVIDDEHIDALNENIFFDGDLFTKFFDDNVVLSSLEKCIMLALKSGESIPTSSQTMDKCGFYEEVNLYMNGVGESEATIKDIKDCLLAMILNGSMEK
jgi:hypothetical protein